MSKSLKWFIAFGVPAVLVVLVTSVLFVTASVRKGRVEPYIRAQAIRYLSERFESDVEIGSLQVRMPRTGAVRLLFTRGAIASVEAQRITLHRKGQSHLPPLIAIQRVLFDLDLGLLYENPKTVPLVTIEGMEINIPPKGERPRRGQNARTSGDAPAKSGHAGTIFDEVRIRNAKLTILPKDPAKVPLRFDIRSLRLTSAGKDVAMKYEAAMTNPKPPGEIQSTGEFGPWQAQEPGDTPLAGSYDFHHADLSVFPEIAGILESTGRFQGTLDTITVHGEASVPDFRLTRSGNPVPLVTRFEVQVDGTNGDTILKPVIAKLGSTNFTTSGSVIKHERERRRGISLDVSMPAGNLVDLLRLATKGSPVMAGTIDLQTKIHIPPLSTKVRDKLQLDGRFRVSGGKLLQSNIQEKIDVLSRKAQGQPQNQAIDEVVLLMAGRFTLEDATLQFKALSFALPGAAIDLTGNYYLDQGNVDFHGALKLDAKVSETMTGWKRWALKPVDPFFSKKGAGTFLQIRISGTAKDPQFGLEHLPGLTAGPASRH